MQELHSGQQTDSVGMGQQLSSQISAGAKEAMTELVRRLLPELAQKIIQEEILRIREEESSLPQGEALAILIKEAFAPRVEQITKEMVRELVMATLPDVAERLLREEIENLKNG